MVNRVSDHRRQQAEDRVQASHSALRFVVFHDRCILADFRFVCNGGSKGFLPIPLRFFESFGTYAPGTGVVPQGISRGLLVLGRAFPFP